MRKSEIVMSIDYMNWVNNRAGLPVPRSAASGRERRRSTVSSTATAPRSRAESGETTGTIYAGARLAPWAR